MTPTAPFTTKPMPTPLSTKDGTRQEHGEILTTARVAQDLRAAQAGKKVGKPARKP